VVVLDDGQVVGTGTHQQLLAECPTYAEFAESQSVMAGGS
jgi:ATP-binding cassette subfamily B protein